MTENQTEKNKENTIAGSTDTDAILPELFVETARLMRQYDSMHRHHGAGPADPRQGQGRILSLLQRSPDISQRELGFLLDMRQQSMGELLRKMEAAGYLTREPSESDRRMMMIHLSEKGKQANLSVRPHNQAFDCLDTSEKEMMVAMLRKISDKLYQEVYEPEDWDNDREREPYRGYGMPRRMRGLKHYGMPCPPPPPMPDGFREREGYAMPYPAPRGMYGGHHGPEGRRMPPPPPGCHDRPRDFEPPYPPSFRMRGDVIGPMDQEQRPILFENEEAGEMDENRF